MHYMLWRFSKSFVTQAREIEELVRLTILGESGGLVVSKLEL